jgi:hypothetical protein
MGQVSSSEKISTFGGVDEENHYFSRNIRFDRSTAHGFRA